MAIQFQSIASEVFQSKRLTKEWGLTLRFFSAAFAPLREDYCGKTISRKGAKTRKAKPTHD
ncbi:MAG: hypothetical protein DMF73_17600 [Acidobacteria bacterium]|nr:MAG: hypothetical protein DMF73_17600 [Acidobacteriota bacterium]